MTDIPVQLVRLLKRIELLEKKVCDDEIGKYSAHSLKEYFDDEMSEEMKAVADKYIEHEECIEICEGNIENLDYRLEEVERKLANIIVALKYSDIDYLKTTFEHTGKDFCGNCKHFDMEGETPVCTLRNEVLGFYANPDDASCSHYEDNFSGKPDRAECQHCPKSQCDNCMGYPF